jgi:hypothetical protein
MRIGGHGSSRGSAGAARPATAAAALAAAAATSSGNSLSARSRPACRAIFAQFGSSAAMTRLLDPFTATVPQKRGKDKTRFRH